MSVLSRYITKEIIKFFLLVMVLVIGIYAIVDFFEKIDNFIEEGAPISRALFYMLLKTPFIVAQMVPVSLLLSIIIVLGFMNKSNEIIALKSSGVSIYTLLKPLIAIGLVTSIVLFFFSETVVPVTMSRANRIWLEEIKKKPSVVSREKKIWMRLGQSIVHIKYFNPSKQTIFGVTLNVFDRNFDLVRRLDATEGKFSEGKWVFYNLMEQILDKKSGKYRHAFFRSKIEKLDLTPDDLQKIVKKSEEMSFMELRHYIHKIKSEGYDASAYWVGLHSKISFPFVCLIFSMAGVGISMKCSRREAISLGITIGIVLVFLYWIFYSFCLSLGTGEMLPAVVAAWTANLVLLCLAVIMLLNAD